MGSDGQEGRRTDGVDLTAQWAGNGPGWAYVDNDTDLANLDAASVDHLLALLSADHLPYEHDRSVSGEQLSLAQLTDIALDRLLRDDNGFALLVEAGRIDHAHHANNAYRALTDTIELARAVAVALERVDLDETLIIVTADHSHVFTIAGYPPIDNDILGFAGRDVEGEWYTTLGYANGPGASDSEDLHPEDPDYRQPTLVELGSETHGGEDVAVYAIGPGAERIGGVIEQDVIGQVLVEAVTSSD